MEMDRLQALNLDESNSFTCHYFGGIMILREIGGSHNFLSSHSLKETSMSPRRRLPPLVVDRTVLYARVVATNLLLARGDTLHLSNHGADIEDVFCCLCVWRTLHTDV
jgi:hypothetical protein